VKKLSEVEKAKLDTTGKASDVARQLAFAGFAVVWLLKANTARPIDEEMLPAVALLAGALFCDALQYIICSLIWTIFYNYQFDKHKSDDAEVDIPGPINWPGYALFWSKLMLLLFGWGALADAAIQRWGIAST
jgi:hypothetical protein